MSANNNIRLITPLQFYFYDDFTKLQEKSCNGLSQFHFNKVQISESGFIVTVFILLLLSSYTIIIYYGII